MIKRFYLLIFIFVLQKSFSQNTYPYPTSGAVGLGTITPTYQLDVKSANQRLFNTGTTNLRIEGSGSTPYSGSYIYLSSGLTKTGDTFNKVRIDVNRGGDTTGTEGVANYQLSRLNGDVYTGIFYRYDDLAGHRFSTVSSRTSTTSNEVMRILPFGSSGYVGIGTQSPTAKLEVIDATGAVFRHSQTANTGGFFRLFSGAYSGNKMNGIVFGTDSTYNNISIGGGTSLGEPASSIYFYTKKRSGLVNSGTNRMTIDSAGNVGIPTATAGFSLRVNKTLVPAGGTGVGIVSDGQIQNNTITGARYFQTSPTIAADVTSITTGAVSHFYANQGQTTYGTTPGEQNGFYAAATLTGATSNFGFRGRIDAATGRWNLYMDGTANNYLRGRLGIGTTSLDIANLAISNPLGGSANFYSLYNYGVVQSEVTGVAAYYRTAAVAVAGATALGNLIHYGAYQSSLGGRTVTNQFGLYVDGSLDDATNNYGIYSAIPVGTGNWNIYAAGTAANHFSGNVLVGKATGSSKLDVEGTVRASNAFPPTEGAGLEMSYGSGQGEVFAYDRTGSVYMPLRLRATTLKLYGGGGAGGIDITATGSIGIGTAAPISKLQVTGAAVTGTIATSYDDILVENTTNAGITIRSNDASTSALRFNSPGSNTTGFGLLVGDYTNTKMQVGTNLANGKLEFLTGNFVSAATMLANGNFGVGTTFPYSRFQASSTSGQNGMILGSPAGVGLTVSNNNNAYGLNFGVHTNGMSWIQAGRLDTGTTPYNLALQSAGGNVGIGTTAPISKLHVAATNVTVVTAVETIETIGEGGRPYTLYKAENGNYGYVGYGINASDVMSVFNYKNAALQFGTNSAPRMSIDNAGGVSIGTSSSKGSLLIKGNDAILSLEGTDHSYIQFFPQTMAGGRKGYLGFPNANSTNLIITNDFTNGSITLRNNSINALVVNSSGQIGINATTIPTDYKLAVGGNIIAEKVKVKKRVGGVWPDYVFSPDYKLPSLEQVEKFTKENSHLPEIPSAKEIENEGQDLGEMNRLLLKKVEELTLYLIDLKKQSDKQSNMLENQSKKIAEQDIEIGKLKINKK
jgi:hypothetical protein